MSSAHVQPNNVAFAVHISLSRKNVLLLLLKCFNCWMLYNISSYILPQNNVMRVFINGKWKNEFNNNANFRFFLSTLLFSLNIFTQIIAWKQTMRKISGKICYNLTSIIAFCCQQNPLDQVNIYKFAYMKNTKDWTGSC